MAQSGVAATCCNGRTIQSVLGFNTAITIKQIDRIQRQLACIDSSTNLCCVALVFVLFCCFTFISLLCVFLQLSSMKSRSSAAFDSTSS